MIIERVASLLRPPPREILALAKREVDPQHVGEFEGIHLGPVPTFVALALIGAAGAAVAPFRIAIRLLHRPQ